MPSEPLEFVCEGRLWNFIRAYNALPVFIKHISQEYSQQYNPKPREQGIIIKCVKSPEQKAEPHKPWEIEHKRLQISANCNECNSQQCANVFQFHKQN